MPSEKPTITAKNKGGRPPFRPTEEQRATVELMSAAGITHKDQSLALGIALETLIKYFREELDSGKSRVTTRVADSLVRQALAGNVSAAIFYLKTQARWRETQEIELTGKDGGPIQTEELSARDVLLSRIAGLAERGGATSGNSKPH